MVFEEIGIFISGLGLFLAAIGLFLNWKSVQENTKAREIQTLSDSFKGIQEIIKDLYVNYKTKSEAEKKEWDSLLFNSIEYFAFLVNNKFINDRKLTSFFDEAIVMWYEEIFLKRHDKLVVNDRKQYPEFKKLYHIIKLRLAKRR